MYNVDISIVGGSISGSYLAALLAEYGYRTLLIEKDKLPRRKACGEGMAAAGKDYLERIGVWQTLRGSYQPFYGYNLFFGELEQTPLKLGHQHIEDSTMPEGYCISRQHLDERLFKNALAQQGVTHLKRRLERIHKNQEGWQLTCGDVVVTSTIVIIASGASVRQLAKHSEHIELSHQPTAAERLGIAYWVKGTWRNNPPSHIHLLQQKGFQALLTPSQDDMLNISLLIDRESIDENGYHKDHFMKEGLAFAERAGFIANEIIEQRGAPAIHSATAMSKADSLFLIGDSAEIFDPIGGLGMLHAFGSATLASQSIHQMLSKQISFREGQLSYQRRRRSFALKLRTITSLSYQLNVKQSRFIRTLVTRFPRISFFFLAQLKKILLRPLSIHNGTKEYDQVFSLRKAL